MYIYIHYITLYYIISCYIILYLEEVVSLKTVISFSKMYHFFRN